MRGVAIVLLIGVAAPAIAADRPSPDRGSATLSHCPRTTSYLANGNGLYRGPPAIPKKLTELPPATGYMAVYRQVGGCEVPLTVVEYRRGQRR